MPLALRAQPPLDSVGRSCQSRQSPQAPWCGWPLGVRGEQGGGFRASVLPSQLLGWFPHMVSLSPLLGSLTQMKKGNTMQQFLQKALEILRKDFSELRWGCAGVRRGAPESAASALALGTPGGSCCSRHAGRRAPEKGAGPPFPSPSQHRGPLPPGSGAPVSLATCFLVLSPSGRQGWSSSCTSRRT